MSAPALRAIPSRAVHLHLSTASSHRTAACQRLAVRSYGSYSAALNSAPARSRLRHDVSGIQPPFALRSNFLPSTISAAAVPGVRHVSFKEMQEQRAREAAAEGKKEEPKAAKKSAAEPEAEAAPAEPEHSAADYAFAQFKRDSDASWFKSRKAQQEEQEQQQKQQAEGEAEEGAEEGGEKKKQEEKEKAAPPPHGEKTPWQVFTETLQTEFKASKEWNEGTKQLGGSIHDFTQNPNVQRARSAYTKGVDVAASTTGKVIMGTAGAIGKSAAWTWDTPVAKVIRKGAGAVGSGVEKATRPVRETEAYKNVKEVIDDGSSQKYGGWTEREERRRKREARDLKMGFKPNTEPLEEDPNAGTNVTVHKDSAWKESWKSFRDSNPAMQRLFAVGSVYRESENPLITTARSISDRIAGFFAENETAQVIKKFREMDPTFQVEPFLEEMRTYILPEVLEAYVKGDVETLKLWLSAAQYSVYAALMAQYTTAGMKSDGNILDIRNVEILNARMLEPGEIPVFVLMARTQEVHVFRNKKTGELAAGTEDKVQQVTYAIGVTRIPEEVANKETRGWKFIEMQKTARDYV